MKLLCGAADPHHLQESQLWIMLCPATLKCVKLTPCGWNGVRGTEDPWNMVLCKCIKNTICVCVCVGVEMFVAKCCQSNQVFEESLAEGKTEDWEKKEVIFVLSTSVRILVLCHDNIHFMLNHLPSLTLQSAWDVNVPCQPKRSKALLL
jgi:hypothetical protein